MSHETSKSLGRRLRDPRFASTFFRGDAIDIGSGSDSLARQIGYWPLLQSVTSWDKEDGDAQELKGVEDNSFDLTYSSHCLEHVHDPLAALWRWIEVTKPDGHLVVAVPDWEMYERRKPLPSRFNPDHKSVFTFERVAELLGHCSAADVIKVERITEHFDPALPEDYDQTQGAAECCIEIICKRIA
jgi:SAM-dependent methyltransferase